MLWTLLALCGYCLDYHLPRRVPYGIRNVRFNHSFNFLINMSGHSEDPVAEESKRFFTFFNLSMILVAITGVEIVIIYVQTFEGSSIIGILFLTSILKFIGVIWWFMHLRWDKILNTVLFLMGLGHCPRHFFCSHLHG